MPGVTAYEVTIGSDTASSDPRRCDRQLVSLVSELDMDGVGGRCSLELGDAELAPPALGAAVTVKLDGGDGAMTVFTGAVEAVDMSPVGQTVHASDGLVRLGRLEVEGSYEDVTADFIVKDLLQQAGVSPGTLQKGPRLPGYLLFKGPRALQHLRRLAELCGVDLYTDGEGKAHFCGPDAGGEHAFTYGENVTELHLGEQPPVADGVEVWGEGAAGSKGADKYYWLPQDLSGVTGKAALDAGKINKGSAGKAPRRLVSGALRSGEAAGNLAEACMQAAAARAVSGWMQVFGAPQVLPGDRVKVTSLPDGHGATGLFERDQLPRVRRVRHMLDMQQGFRTRLDF